MTAYWQGFLAGALTGLALYVGCGVLVVAWFTRALRPRDGVEP